MTREEQIRQAANESLPNKNKDNGFYEAFELVLIQYFIKGAQWADEHPAVEADVADERIADLERKVQRLEQSLGWVNDRIADAAYNSL